MKNIWLLLILLCSPVYAQLDITVTSDKYAIEGMSELELTEDMVFSKTIPTKVVPAGRIVIKPESKTVFLSFAFDQESKQFVEFTKNKTTDGTLAWSWTHPKPVKVKFTIIDFTGGKSFEHEQVVQITTTPAPSPEPTPTPTPTPDVPVTKLDNLSVLFLFETGKLSSYKGDDKNTLQSVELKKWFQEQLPEPGGLSRVRWYDQNTNYPACTTLQCKWLSTARPPTIPGMVVGNENQVVYSGKILSIEDTKALILKYKK